MELLLLFGFLLGLGMRAGYLQRCGFEMVQPSMLSDMLSKNTSWIFLEGCARAGVGLLERWGCALVGIKTRMFLHPAPRPF
jgi:hypothetical protein